MTEYLLATPELHDLSISITLYDNRQQKTRRAFFLRNLTGESSDQQLFEARSILNAVAEELYYITSAGVDKGEIKAGGKKVDEVIYQGLVPKTVL